MTNLELLPGLGLGIGLALILEVWQSRRLALAKRVLKEKSATKVDKLSKIQRITIWFFPLWEQLGSTRESVESRLLHLDSGIRVEQFRLWQLLSAVIATGLSTSLLAWLATVRSVGVITWLVLLVASFCAGPVILDRILTAMVKRQSERISQQVADTAQLLALSISAGESIPAALARVSRVCGPELSQQLSSVVEAVESGVAQSRALVALEQRTQSAQLARLLGTLVTASERGAPLATVLREQARDLRDEARRNLLESGGRHEIAMLMPVVFVILPITIMFALYPGLLALRL
ncbi:MAG: type II secretion system F family protein [Actinomycetaceae bacterium]|nr:type II secretion system F family protein [Actinomycetaceae bacterium]